MAKALYSLNLNKAPTNCRYSSLKPSFEHYKDLTTSSCHSIYIPGSRASPIFNDAAFNDLSLANELETYEDEKVKNVALNALKPQS